jgi:predicted transcriptional regulator
MTLIVRIALLCLLLAALPFIAAAEDNGGHDNGYDAGGASGSGHGDGDSSGDSRGGDSGDHDYSGGESGSGNHDGDSSGWDRDSGKDSSDGGSAAGNADDGDGKSSDRTEASGSEDHAPAAAGHNDDDKETSRDTGDDRSRTGSDDGDHAQAAAGHNDDDKETSRDTGDDHSRTGSDDGDKGYSAFTGSSSGESVDRAVDRDDNGAGDDLPDTVAIFSRLTSGDSGKDSPAPRDGAMKDRNAAGHREKAGKERKTFPLPEDVPDSRAPFADNPALPSSGLPLGTASGATAGSSTPVRMKSKDETEPFWHPTDSALVLNPWMLLKLWCFLGFRRVLRKNVLESDERRSLYESIAEHPGVDLSRLTGMLRLNKETARYHLKMLSQNGKISGLIKQGIARYFPCRETLSEFEKTVIHYVWIATTKRILLLLIETPGLTRQAIARELGIAGPSVTWQMQRLAEDGLIEVRTEGRFVRYFLTPDSIEVLETVTKADRRAGPAFV